MSSYISGNSYTGNKGVDTGIEAAILVAATVGAVKIGREVFAKDPIPPDGFFAKVWKRVKAIFS